MGRARRYCGEAGPVADLFLILPVHAVLGAALPNHHDEPTKLCINNILAALPEPMINFFSKQLYFLLTTPGNYDLSHFTTAGGVAR